MVMAETERQKPVTNQQPSMQPVLNTNVVLLKIRKAIRVASHRLMVVLQLLDYG
jgi:hypothetical protein